MAFDILKSDWARLESKEGGAGEGADEGSAESYLAAFKADPVTVQHRLERQLLLVAMGHLPAESMQVGRREF